MSYCGRPARPKNLHYVQHADVDEVALVGIVHLRALDDYGMCRQVDTPGQSGRADQHLDHTSPEQFLDQIAVHPEHAGVMNGEAGLEQLL